MLDALPKTIEPPLPTATVAPAAVERPLLSVATPRKTAVPLLLMLKVSEVVVVTEPANVCAPEVTVRAAPPEV